MKKIVLFVMLLLTVSVVAAQEFPGPFVVNGKPVSNLVVVVGDTAPAEDVITAAKIANALKAPYGSTKLASEIDDITRYNSIILGNACYNPLIALLLNNPEQCATSGLKLIKHANGNAALLIMGATPEEVGVYADRWLSSVSVQPVRPVPAEIVPVPVEIVPVVPEIGVPRPEEYQKCLAELEVVSTKVRDYEQQGYIAPYKVKEFLERTGETRKPIPQDVWDAYQRIASRCRDLMPYTYDVCVRAYNDKAQSLRNRMDELGAKRVEYEGLVVCGERFGRLIPPEPKEYPEYEKCMAEGKKQLIEKYGAEVPNEAWAQLREQCTPFGPPEESADYRKCVAKLNEELQAIKDEATKYEQRGERMPDELLSKYNEMSQRCLPLAGWRMPVAMPVEGVPAPVPVPPGKEEVVPALEYVPPAEKPCVGCRQNGACLQYGIRLVSSEGKPVYCDVDGSFKPQKALGESCQNNYECASNSCADQQCVSVQERLEAVEKELKEQRSILQKIMDFFKRLFGG